MVSDKGVIRGGDGVIRSGKGVIRARQDFLCHPIFYKYTQILSK